VYQKARKKGSRKREGESGHVLKARDQGLRELQETRRQNKRGRKKKRDESKGKRTVFFKKRKKGRVYTSKD